MKKPRQREKTVPRWVNDVVPTTLDALKIYANYLEDEFKHLKIMNRRLTKLYVETCRRIDARKQSIKSDDLWEK